MSLEVDIRVAGEMNTAENQEEIQQNKEMRGEVVGVEGIGMMEPGGDTMEEETDVEAGAGRTIGEEVERGMKKGGAETGMRKEGASPGRDGGAGAEAGREGSLETLKTGQVVGGAGMRREAEEEVEIGTEEEEEVTRKDNGAEKRESRRERSR